METSLRIPKLGNLHLRMVSSHGGKDLEPCRGRSWDRISNYDTGIVVKKKCPRVVDGEECVSISLDVQTTTYRENSL